MLLDGPPPVRRGEKEGGRDEHFSGKREEIGDQGAGRKYPNGVALSLPRLKTAFNDGERAL